MLGDENSASRREGIADGRGAGTELCRIAALEETSIQPSSLRPSQRFETHTAIFNDHGEWIFTQEVLYCIRSEDVLSVRVIVELVSRHKVQRSILDLDVPHSQRTEGHHHGQWPSCPLGNSFGTH